MPSSETKQKRLNLPQIHEDHVYHWLSNSHKFSKAQVLPLIKDELPSLHLTGKESTADIKLNIKQALQAQSKQHQQNPLSNSADASPSQDGAQAAGRLWRKSKLLLGVFVAVVAASSIVGPVVHFRNQQAAAAAAKASERNQVVLPLPPMVPLTRVFYDGFSYISNDSWTYTIELQCYTAGSDNVDIIAPDPTTTNLRLQATYHSEAVKCAEQWPVNTTKTHWTSGRITSKSKHTFLPPSTEVSGVNKTLTGAGNCTSLFIEARMQFPAVQGSRAAFLLLPEPQNQTTNSSTSELPRCRWVDECGKYGRWPESGEIDVVSHSDSLPEVVHAIQIQEYGKHRWRAAATGLVAATGWHTYKLEWSCNCLRWFVDDIQSFQVSRQSLQSWPFDQPFFLAIEYSIGGRLVNPEVDLVNSFMLVDYVRVWPDDRQPPTEDIIEMDVAQTEVNRTEVALSAPPSPVQPLAALSVADLSKNALYAVAAKALQTLAFKINNTIAAQQTDFAANASAQSNNSSRNSDSIEEASLNTGDSKNSSLDSTSISNTSNNISNSNSSPNTKVSIASTTGSGSSIASDGSTTQPGQLDNSPATKSHFSEQKDPSPANTPSSTTGSSSSSPDSSSSSSSSSGGAPSTSSNNNSTSDSSDGSSLGASSNNPVNTGNR